VKQPDPTRRRRKSALSMILVATLLASACAGDDDSDQSDSQSAGTTSATGGTASDATGEAGEPRQGGTLDIAFHHYPATLDPHAGDNGFDVWVLNAIFDRLVELDPETQEPLPALATEWEFADDTLVLTLREGVSFHDGTPFNAEAVQYNIERAKGLGETEAELEDVESVEVLSDNQVQLNLSRPNTALVPILGRRAGMMISPTAAEAAGDAVGEQPVGTGAYKLTSRVTDESYVLERNEDYWQEGLPYLDTLKFHVMEDSRTRLNALLSGQVDFVLTLDPPDLTRAEQASGQGVVVATAPSDAMNRCQLNLGGDGPVTDVNVRKALNYAINRDAMNQVLTNGAGRVSGGEVFALPPTHWAYPTDVLPLYEHDPDRARELLAEAGHDDGITLRYATYSTPTNDSLAAMLEEQLGEVGVTLETTVYDVTEVTAAYLESGDFDMYCGLQGARPDPWGTLQHWLTWIPAPWEPPAEMEALIADTIATDDIAERQAAFNALGEYMFDQEAMGIGLTYGVSIQAHTDDVRGYTNTGQTPDLRLIWRDE
jgi:ABC-type transport system substrate-binding protein